MAELRQKTHSILLSKEGKSVSVELFPASLWPSQSQTEGEFRLRIDGKWYSPAGKYTFLGAQAIAALFVKFLSGDEPFLEEQPPALQVHQRVSVGFGECVDGIPIRTKGGFIMAPPFRGVDGRWYTIVSTFDGYEQVLCQDITIRSRR